MARPNGHRMAGWAGSIPEPTAPPAPPLPARPPRCPKHCDVATPPERVGRARYVCSGCGTEFTWKESPS